MTNDGDPVYKVKQLNKKSINKTWEVPRYYQGILEKLQTIGALINR